MWTFNPDETFSKHFFNGRIKAAQNLRESLCIPNQTNAYRIISAEADGLPGLIVDRYDDILVCQFLSAGMEFWKSILVDKLQSLPNVKTIYERSDVEVRKKEGLKPCQGLLWGDEPPALVEIKEHNIKFYVDIKNGHKTGFYLDQRDNRLLVKSYSDGAEVLNCFAYTGGFGIASLKGGAKHVTNIEDTTGLIDLIDKNLHLNKLDNQHCTNVKADVFQLLRRYEKEGKFFDLIILDPPKFADAQSHITRAARGYKDINILAFKLLRPGGLLFTFSCSGLIKMDLFQKIVADAAIDSGRDAKIIKWLGQSLDHPVKLNIPETSYLKGLCVGVSG
jgi:23S rRNA (cytosine1962-C5)-methyltransferase